MYTMQELIDETNQLRDTYLTIPNTYDFKFLTNFKKSFSNTKKLIKHPCASYFLKDLEDSLANKTISLLNTKKYINDGEHNFIFSIFKASYFPELRVEACLYEKLNVDPFLQKNYHTNVLPVTIKMASKGFYSREVVALFPENHIDMVQLNHDGIFYFINKFVDRFFKTTHKMISAIVADNFFQELTFATYDQIEQASIYWVWLHEYYHRQGPLPIPKYLSVKSLKPLAGLEEMRVDICSIITCLDDNNLAQQQGQFVSRFILAERLLRYSIEGIPKPSYDAIASQLLFNYLRQNEGLIIDGLKIHLTKNLSFVLKRLLQEIHSIEAGINVKSEKEIQQDLLAFTKSYTNFNDQEQDFYHIAYFKQVKELLHL